MTQDNSQVDAAADVDARNKATWQFLTLIKEDCSTLLELTMTVERL